jgi:aryl-alcohol dehydrogenase-like predicted oxidoreductase
VCVRRWDYSDGRFVDAAKHLVTLQGEGLLGEVAACNFDTPHLRTMVEAGVPIVANQVQYSLLDRRPETAMLAYAKAQGIRLATFGTVAGGLLSDKFLNKPAHWHPPGFKTVSMRMYRPHLDRWSGGDWNLFQELLRTLRAIADKHTHSDHVQTIATVASAWVLHQLGPDGGWVIIGVRDDSHLIEHKALRDLVLDADDAAKINEVLAKGVAPVGDIWSYERGG